MMTNHLFLFVFRLVISFFSVFYGVSCIECDLANECSTAAIIDYSESITCSGYSSCSESTALNTSEASLYDINCYGGSSCISSQAAISGDYLYCHGDKSCAGIEMTNDASALQYLQCYGLNSCTNATIRTNGLLYPCANIFIFCFV